MSSSNCKCSCTAGLVGLSLAGFLLSLYTSYVEIRVERDHGYQAMCDISERVSCTKVFTSAYGRGFGLVGPLLGEQSPLNLPNGFYGIFYYFLVAGLSFSNSVLVTRFVTYLIGLSNLLSLYLAYLLYFVLEDLCVVCVTTYAVNLISLIVAMQKVQIVVREEQVMRVIQKNR
ncbi:vitamin K epoxide reductase complex subunit 1-like protein 1 [Wyeomyia smithii]|uniref:vitamin K epoxide reductase complex subunit 1-like protein 1 n=1 Tax=Wyeomyia smithii TaxID=174621 RepID=UPI002467BCA1|nr:vitamin K epoxide reductase complex subunit 1-like protein 1 [Wyeomyia smithii]